MPKYDSINFSTFLNTWQSPFVARSEVGRFSGGILNAKYLANLDSQGKGPSGRVRIGRKVAYPTQSLIDFMEERAEVI
jgi:hypothetical protein